MPKVKSGLKAKRAAQNREKHLRDLGESIESISPALSSRASKCKTHQEEMSMKDEKTTTRIMKVAKLQQDDLQENIASSSSSSQKLQVGKPVWVAEGEGDDYDKKDCYDGADVMKELQQFDAEDMASFEQFMPAEPRQKISIAKLLSEKLLEKKNDVALMKPDLQGNDEEQIPENLVEQYRLLAEFLSKYRSGKMPKIFKFVPRLKKYEEVLEILDPDNWTAASVQQATKYFSSATSERAQKFFYYVLLPRIRDDISFYKRLNPHLHLALKKAIFQPEAFIKGIILPLCESGTCTLREAVIISGILAKVSFPMIHASTAMFFISEMKYNGAISIFLRTFICKKYSLPFRALDAIVDHFMSFERRPRGETPVLWHLCLKSFVEIYGAHLSTEQREQLGILIKTHKHPGISPDIHKILQSFDTTDVEMSVQEMMALQ